MVLEHILDLQEYQLAEEYDGIQDAGVLEVHGNADEEDVDG
jgi:hypothetical protein